MILPLIEKPRYIQYNKQNLEEKSMLKLDFSRGLDNGRLTDVEAMHILKEELEKGIKSMNEEPLFTIEEAWKEIDAI